MSGATGPAPKPQKSGTTERQQYQDDAQPRDQSRRERGGGGGQPSRRQPVTHAKNGQRGDHRYDESRLFEDLSPVLQRVDKEAEDRARKQPEHIDADHVAMDAADVVGGRGR